MKPRRIAPAVPLPPGVYGRPPAARLPFPLEERGCSIFARARHGLWQGVQALGLGNGDSVLVPAYHHGSEVEALLNAGLRPQFYEGTADLEPDPGELETLLDDDTRALYLIHYLGSPQDAARWRAWCDERELLLIEDAAQAWLARADGRPVGSYGDLAIFCLYKTFGVPDGGAMLVCDRTGPSGGPKPPVPDAAPASGTVAALRRHAAWAFQRSSPLAAVHGLAEQSSPYDPARDFGLGDPGAAPSLATQRLLHRVADERAAATRRANYDTLSEELADLVPRPFARLPAGASPFAFPIEVDDKSAMLRRLAGRGISGMDFWSVPHPALPHARFPSARRRRERTIALPVHQELRPADVDRVAAAAGGRSGPRRDLRLETVHSLAELEPEWKRLAERTGNIFSSWEWAEVWWRHFGRDRDLQLVRVTSHGRLVAILPLYVFSKRPNVIRFIGHGPADELAPVCAAADRVAAARALRSILARLRPDVLLVERLAGDRAWGALLGGRVMVREGSPVVDLAGTTWDALMGSWSPNMRSQIRRSERRLEREHGLRFRLAADGERLDRDLDLLFDLHAVCWPDTHSEFARAHRSFHREFAAVALERGWLRLWFLEAEGQPVAAQLVYRFCGVDSYYQSGRSPEWQRQSVGTVLMAHTIRTALADGMREYRLLRGHEPYKYRLATRDPELETVAMSGRRLPDAALAARRALPERLAVLVRRRMA